jgi:hypothetical protein
MDWTVVVAMGPMRKMQMVFHHIVYMISVRDGFMPAREAVKMFGIMRITRMVGSAASRVRFADGEGVFIHMSIVDVVKMPIVKIILMPIVPDKGVTTTGAVHMGMFVMNTVFAHGVSFLDDGCFLHVL